MIKKSTLLLFAFLTGFSVMVIELTAARIVAPIIGSSIYTWTSIIGIILLGTSIGNHLGGRLVDKKNNKYSLSKALLTSSLLVLYIPPIAEISKKVIYLAITPLISAITISIFIFILPAIALGFIYPILAKYLIRDIDDIGTGTGSLSASWSLGSITGTFMTGFVFIGYIGSTKTILAISILLLVFSLVANEHLKSIYRYVAIYVLLFALYLGIMVILKTDASNIYAKESNYYSIRVADRKLAGYGETRILFLDADSHSMESLSKTKIDSYTNFYPIFSIFNKNIEKIAVIGAGSLELSNNFKNYYPNAAVITAEIDPAVTTTAKKYFKTSNYVVENTISKDGRVFLAESKEQYDVLFSDAYNSFISVPWHLTTKEFFQLAKLRLNKDGVFAINFISAQSGENSALYKSLFSTFSSVFNNNHIFAYGNNKENVQNMVLIGINSDKKMTKNELELKILSSLTNSSLKLIDANDQISNNILTDDFAPIDRLMMPSMNNYFKSYKKNFLYQER